MFIYRARDFFQLILIVVVILIAPVAGAALSATAPYEYRKVVLAGDQAPGQPGQFGGYFSQQFILPDGRVGFVNHHANDHGVFETNVWVEANTGLTHVIGPGVALTQLGAGVIVDRVEQYPNQGEDGRIGIEAFVRGPGITTNNDKVLLLWDEGAIQVVAQEGDSTVLSGVNASLIEGFSTPQIANTGITFESLIAGQGVTSGNNKVLWHQDHAGKLSVIAREGDRAPGLAPGVTHGDLGFGSFINSDGTIGLLNFVTGPGLGSDSRAIWIGESNNLQLLTQTGDQAPMLSDGVSFTRFGPPRLNREGNGIFYAEVFGPGYNAGIGNHAGYWLYRAGQVAPLPRAGDIAPDTGTAEVFERVNVEGFSGNDQVVFVGDLKINLADTASSGWGIWAGTPDDYRLVYRGGYGDGDQAPGVEAGLELRDPDAWVNRNGLVVVTARLSGPGLTSENNRGIWVTGPGGELELLLRYGDEFDVDPTPFIEDLRKITSIDFNHAALSSESGGDLGFNGDNELVLRLTFEDTTSGVYVFNVPEPSSFMLFVVGLGILGIRKEKRG